MMEFLADPGLTSIFTREAAFVVLSLVVIEGLLSVDNALAIAAMARHLELKQRKIAMTVGYAGAYGFRLLALLIADFIIRSHWLMVLGASYLIWLMCNHFAESEESEGVEGIGEPESKEYGFAKTIVMIALLDLSLSFDNVVAAVAFARDNIWLVYLGVTIGIVTLRLVAGYCIRLIAQYPWLEHTAFILVGFVGVLLCTELIWDEWIRTDVSIGPFGIIEPIEGGHYHIAKLAKFTGIVAIILGHILYESVPAVKTVLRPPMRVIKHGLASIANGIALVVRCLLWPVRKAWK